MLEIPPHIVPLYQAFLNQCSFPPSHYIYYETWLRFYLDFCRDAIPSIHRFPGSRMSRSCLEVPGLKCEIAPEALAGRASIPDSEEDQWEAARAASSRV
jgi:hypothetical protein